ncbi:acrosin-like [Phyllostomus discolor]|uniref:Acrosin-like n=1 Tax=Phyllostomus discolor TaxID=89673 RepID=A0A7E6DQB0_9CHIR|nr:acrosin-like [Phyllostomus discolor]
MVSLQVLTNHDSWWYHACRGSLLNAQKAHDRRLVFGAREIKYGSNQPVKPPLQERFVQKIVPSQSYSPILEANGITLVKLTPPVVCGSFIGPGCLPHFSAGPPRVSHSCWVTGWGFLREDAQKMSPVLQEALVSILDLGLCNSTLWYRGRVRSTNVCAGHPEGYVDTCQQLMETPKRKTLSGGRSSDDGESLRDDSEAVGFPELASLSTDPGNLSRLKSTPS